MSYEDDNVLGLDQINVPDVASCLKLYRIVMQFQIVTNEINHFLFSNKYPLGFFHYFYEHVEKHLRFTAFQREGGW